VAAILRRKGGALTAMHHLRIGAVLFANEETILLTDRTLFVAPAGMHLPVIPSGSTVVIEYEIVEGRNILTTVPTIRI
jgi:hypothetical protein